MSMSEVEVAGTLRADGTVQLDQKPNIAPGRVTVVLRHETQAVKAQPPGDAFFQLMDEIWTGQKARGFVPRMVEEIRTEHHRLGAEAEEEIEAAIRLQEESRRLRAHAEEERQSP